MLEWIITIDLEHPKTFFLEMFTNSNRTMQFE